MSDHFYGDMVHLLTNLTITFNLLKMCLFWMKLEQEEEIQRQRNKEMEQNEKSTNV